MLNLLAKFRFQMFNMIALLDLKLIIRTSSVNNFRARDSTFIFTILRTAEMLENVGILVPKKVFINTSVKMPIGFTNITSSIARTNTETCTQLVI